MNFFWKCLTEIHPINQYVITCSLYSIAENVYLCYITDNMFWSQSFDPDADYVPTPVVLIDQDSDSSATIVQLSFGDRLGALVDTVE